MMRKRTHLGFLESPTAAHDVAMMILLYTRKFIFRSILNKFMCARHKGRWLVKPQKPNYACNNSIKLPPILFSHAFAGRVWGSSAAAAAAVCMTICHNIVSIIIIMWATPLLKPQTLRLPIRKRDLTDDEGHRWLRRVLYVSITLYMYDVRSQPRTIPRYTIIISCALDPFESTKKSV